MICTICENFIPCQLSLPAVCDDCTQRIQSLTRNRMVIVDQVPVHIVFSYDFEVRDLIARAKIKNDAVALGYLMKFVREAARNFIALYNVSQTLVMSAPPSFWGRFHCRFDIAQHVRQELFPRSQHAEISRTKSFLRKKRAGRNGNLAYDEVKWLKSLANLIQAPNKLKLEDKVNKSTDILVVDDILTTGFTMKSMIQQLRECGAQNLAGVVLASPSC